MPGGDLALVRAALIASIAANTETLILKGFSYGGKQFALDPDSRQKWLALKTLESTLSWPVTVSAMVGEYVLIEANLDSFLATALTVVQGYKDSGRALRLQAEAATDALALSKVVDNRT